MLVSDARLFSGERSTFAFFFKKFQKKFVGFLNFKKFLIFKISFRTLLLRNNFSICCAVGKRKQFQEV